MTPDERRRLLFQAEQVGLRVINEVKQERAPEIHRAIGRKIFDTEREEHGSRFFTSNRQAYMLDGVERHVHPIRLEDPGFASWLNVRYGLSKSDKLTRLVVEFLHDRTLVYTEQITPSRFSHYDQRNNILYIDANDGQVWRLNGQGPPQLVLNGQGVFFLSNGPSPSFSEADIGPHQLLLDYLVNDLNFACSEKGITPIAQRHLFAAWLHLLAFGDWPGLANGKPLLMVEGMMRAGKSMALKRVAHLLNGRASAMILSEQGESDFSVQLLHSVPVAHIDNQDRYIKWLPDAVAAYCTDGVWRKRKLHTDDTMHEIRPNCFIAVSSADPKSFRRNDIADRSIVIRLERFKAGTEGDEGALIDRIAENRNKLIGEWLYNLNNILAALPSIRIDRPTSRLTSWERFFHACRGPLNFDAQVNALVEAQSERIEFTTEEEPAIFWIDKWLEVQSNVGKRLTASDLWGELKEMAGGEESSFLKRWRREAPFAKWLKGAEADLYHKGIVLEVSPNPDRRKYNVPVYSFTRTED